jgi:hypothetical protein
MDVCRGCCDAYFREHHRPLGRPASVSLSCALLPSEKADIPHDSQRAVDGVSLTSNLVPVYDTETIYSFLVLSVDDVLGDSEPGLDIITINLPTYDRGAPLMNIVSGINIIVGIYCLRLGFVRRRMNQVFAWIIWICICVTEVFLVNGFTEDGLVYSYWEGSAWYYGKYSVVIISRLIWLWLLINWVLTRKGSS